MKIEFTLNGNLQTLDVPPDRRVIDLVRHNLGLTGSKEGCGSGECGACSILVDGESRLSCLMLAAQLHGRTVTTIEGIAADPAQTKLVRSFVRHGAAQCGYCSPGMIVSAADLLRRNPHPRRTDISTAISGNLCRCTGYQKIVDAVAIAADEDSQEFSPPPWVSAEDHTADPKPLFSKPSFDPRTFGTNQTEVLFPESGDALLKLAGKQTDYRLMAGGTDLLVWRRENRSAPRVLIGIERVPELQRISMEGNDIVIGAAATFQQIDDAPLVREHLDLLRQAIRVLGSPPILHMATLGGNLCTASPAADSLPPLYALQAKVEIRSLDGRRIVPISQFILGPRQTDLRSGEILWSVHVPIPETGMRHRYFKVGRRKALAIAVVSLAATWSCQPDGALQDIHLAWGSVGPTVMVFPEIEKMLLGKPLTVENLKSAAALVQERVLPIDDVRASAHYRRLVSGNLLLKLLEA
ncbi:MAG TPA: FAD binding domain-containing protein [Candidatus Paceibacterota bacterium]|nr:FAD binding domain-containing protein [Verrucomicrobiota bacterium]HSA01394.1 FAD binding domain-containing protein [Candidatus Paceibacterota bacterium]